MSVETTHYKWSPTLVHYTTHCTGTKRPEKIYKCYISCCQTCMIQVLLHCWWRFYSCHDAMAIMLVWLWCQPRPLHIVLDPQPSSEKLQVPSCTKFATVLSSIMSCDTAPHNTTSSSPGLWNYCILTYGQTYIWHISDETGPSQFCCFILSVWRLHVLPVPPWIFSSYSSFLPQSKTCMLG